MMSSNVEAFLRFSEEGERAGTVLAEFVRPGTRTFEEIDGQTMSSRLPCMVCKTRPDIPTAFVAIRAAEGATCHLPMPLCSECAYQSPAYLQRIVRRQLRGLMPTAVIEFVMDSEPDYAG